jgi:hypothetical protein
VVYYFHDDGREKFLLWKVKLSMKICSGVFEDESEDFDDAGGVHGRCGHG